MWSGQLKGIPFDFIGFLNWFPVAVSQLVLSIQSATGNYTMADSTDRIVGLSPKADWATSKKIIHKFVFIIFICRVQIGSWLLTVQCVTTINVTIFSNTINWINKCQTLHGGTSH